jgi:hypothetical protein
MYHSRQKTVERVFAAIIFLIRISEVLGWNLGNLPESIRAFLHSLQVNVDLVPYEMSDSRSDKQATRLNKTYSEKILMKSDC